MNLFEIIVGMLAGLALFLFGMSMMSESLKKFAGDGFRIFLGKMTGNRFSSLMSGTVITALTQSSSVTTVLLVGFVSAGLLNLSQSVGVIMGANIGSTVTAQIIAFKITHYALLMVTMGFFYGSVVRNKRKKQIGWILMGLGLIFFGMDMMSQASSPLRTYPPFIEFMGEMQRPILGVIAGVIFTAIVQSSAATTGLLIILAGQNIINLEAGIAMAFGANIGTCVTAMLATIGKPREALQVAVLHGLFNVMGVVVWIFFIPQLADWVTNVSPAYPNLPEAERLAKETPRQLANAHSLFKTVNALIALPFCSALAALVEKIVPIREESPDLYAPKHIHKMYLSNPGMALEQMALEVANLASWPLKMNEITTKLLFSQADRELFQLQEMKQGCARLYERIIQYSGQLGVATEDPKIANQIERLLCVANNINQIIQVQASISKQIFYFKEYNKVEFSLLSKQRILELERLILCNLEQMYCALKNRDPELARQVISSKKVVRNVAVACNTAFFEELRSGNEVQEAAYRLEGDTVSLLKRIYYLSKRVAKYSLSFMENLPEISDDDEDEEIEF